MPVIKVVHTGSANGKQTCMLHAETYDRSLVLAAAPGGVSAGWTVPAMWVNLIDGEEVITANPKLNSRNMLMWLLIKE